MENLTQLDFERRAMAGHACEIAMLSDEIDDFFAESFPLEALSFPAQQTEAIRETSDFQARRVRSCDPLQTVTEESEEGEFIACARLADKFGEGELDRRIGELEVSGNIRKPEGLEDLKDGGLEIVDIDAVFFAIALEIEGDTLCNMLGQPPAVMSDLFCSLPQ